MKKLLFSVLATLCVALGAFTLTSCGGDDDGGSSSAKVVEVHYAVEVNPTADMLKYCDLELVYQDADGTSVKKIEEGPQAVKLAFKNFPVAGTLKYTCKPKSGVTIPEDGTYNAAIKMVIASVKLYSNGKQTAASVEGPDLTSKSLTASKFSEWIAKHATLYEKKINLDKDGE